MYKVLNTLVKEALKIVLKFSKVNKYKSPGLNLRVEDRRTAHTV